MGYGIDPSASVGGVETLDTKSEPFRVGYGGTLGIDSKSLLHTDAVYTALINAVGIMEGRLQDSLKNYQEHPDVQANLQQLQYDLQTWNLALTTMTNINKNLGDAMNSIASNFR